MAKNQTFTIYSLIHEFGEEKENPSPYFRSLAGRPLGPGEILVPAVQNPEADAPQKPLQNKENMIRLRVGKRRYNVILAIVSASKKKKMWKQFNKAVNLYRKNQHQHKKQQVHFVSIEGSQNPEGENSRPSPLDRLPSGRSVEDIVITRVAFGEYMARLKRTRPREYQYLAAVVIHPDWTPEDRFQHMGVGKSQGYAIRNAAFERVFKFLGI
ncbi:MAG: hypothetical protein ACLRS1_01450 [Oscillospiraceae bacterium]